MVHEAGVQTLAALAPRPPQRSPPCTSRGAAPRPPWSSGCGFHALASTSKVAEKSSLHEMTPPPVTMELCLTSRRLRTTLPRRGKGKKGSDRPTSDCAIQEASSLIVRLPIPFHMMLSGDRPMSDCAIQEASSLIVHYSTICPRPGLVIFNVLLHFSATMQVQASWRYHLPVAIAIPTIGS